MAADVAGAGAGRLRGGADRLRARACLRGGGDRVRGGGAVEDPAGAGRSGQDRPARRRAAGAGCCAWASWWRCACPSRDEEAARDLVRAREDARGDLMRARHRLSKLLLRHGSGLRRRAPGRSRTTPGCAGSASRSAAARARLRRVLRPRCCRQGAPRRARPGDRRAGRRAALRRGRRAARLPARRLHADRVRADGRARRLAALPAAVARPLPRPRAERGLHRRAPPPGRDHQDRQHATPAGCWSRRPGTSAGRCAPSATLERRRQGQPAAVRARADRSARRLHARWHALERRGKRRTIVAVAVARELAGYCWALGDHELAARRQPAGEESAPAQRREERSATQL